jgi:aryl-alcohol dehydrogenase-like predicted oxidoreductase
MKLILGTAQFGDPYGISNTEKQSVSDFELCQILELAKAEGIGLLDCAQGYGNSNQRIARYFQKHKGTFSLINKFNLSEDSLIDIELEKFKAELHAFGLDYFSVLMIHNVASLASPIATDLLHVLKREGLAEQVGVSVSDVQEYRYALKCFDFEVAQIPINIFNQSFADSTLLERRIEHHGRSFFLQGLLLMKVNDIPSHMNLARARVSELDRLARSIGLNRLQLCLLYAIQQPYADKFVIGVQKKRELEEILEAYHYAARQSHTISIDWHSLSLDDPYITDPRQWIN